MARGHELQKEWNLPLGREHEARVGLVVPQVALELVDGGGQLGEARALLAREQERHAIQLEAAARGVIAELELPPGLKPAVGDGLHDLQGVVGAVRREEVGELGVRGVRVLPLHILEDARVHLDALVLLDVLEGLLEAGLLRVAEDPHSLGPDFEGLVLRACELASGELLRVHEAHLAATWKDAPLCRAVPGLKLFGELAAAILLHRQAVAELADGLRGLLAHAVDGRRQHGGLLLAGRQLHLDGL